MAIGCAQSIELIDDDPLEHRAHTRAWCMVLGQPADPQVDVVDRSVQALQLRLDCHVRRDLIERTHPRQAVGRAHGVVVGQPVVTSALNVERCEVKAAGSGRAEEEVADVIDDQQVDLLSSSRGRSLEERVDIALVVRKRRIEDAGVEECGLQSDGSGRGRGSVVVQSCELTVEQAMAVPERCGCELIGH
ncbi:unannotated protein [freshwater metagenome]|uniref:Unannotated protein n=1 Tax=freshwater metagenome TaxID=449393 RepID=A0A6J7IZN7_9ZZZZ